MQKIEEKVLELDFDQSQPKHSPIKCGFGETMVYGNFTHRFGHGSKRFVVHNVPAWICPEVCPKRELKHCLGQQFMEDPIAQQLIKADTYYEDTYGHKV